MNVKLSEINKIKIYFLLIIGALLFFLLNLGIYLFYLNQVVDFIVYLTLVVALNLSLIVILYYLLDRVLKKIKFDFLDKIRRLIWLIGGMLWLSYLNIFIQLYSTQGFEIILLLNITLAIFIVLCASIETLLYKTIKKRTKEQNLNAKVIFAILEENKRLVGDIDFVISAINPIIDRDNREHQTIIDLREKRQYKNVEFDRFILLSNDTFLNNVDWCEDKWLFNGYLMEAHLTYVFLEFIGFKSDQYPIFRLKYCSEKTKNTLLKVKS